MRVLVTNDDGPPQDLYSPYIANFVAVLQKLTDWEIVVAVPHQQRSWIGKAHLYGTDVATTHAKYAETGDLDWKLLNSTPAACANIGVKHFGPFDLVISGPNYGRNTSAAYIMSSGTVGAATEAALCGSKAIALSYSYTQLYHPEEQVTRASKLSLAILKYLWTHWSEDAQLYSVNVPVFEGLCMQTPIKYTTILQNKWSDLYMPSEQDRETFQCAPNYATCDATAKVPVAEGTDAWVVMHNEASVTPIRAVFQAAKPQSATIDLSN